MNLNELLELLDELTTELEGIRGQLTDACAANPEPAREGTGDETGEPCRKSRNRN